MVDIGIGRSEAADEDTGDPASDGDGFVGGCTGRGREGTIGESSVTVIRRCGCRRRSAGVAMSPTTWHRIYFVEQ